MKWLHGLLAALAVVVVGACGSSSGSGIAGSPSASATTGRALTVAELKLALIHGLGAPWYCDPDLYPIARADQADVARERWPQVTADAAALAAIDADLGIAPGPSPSDQEKLAAYARWKLINAIALEPAGGGAWRFDYLAQPRDGATEGSHVDGTMSATGAISVEHQTPAPKPNCPICLARGSRIETPGGGVPVEAVRIGDLVWTVDGAGSRVAGSVLALGSTRAPVGHHVVRLVLADRRSVTASPGHPLADGRPLGDLRPGDVVDGSRVVTADLVPYADASTYDIVVSGATGDYFIDGIALGSTLR